ncbi:PREDICTED: NACHT, LRR and PYD domains-containing protein 4-like [Nanorana parkeri]|uniref:NACHT, LRR and PYD domains-containing protein 4-like n=1 Tax=Nanorana parkeri TaxID=125878 RepID=UPI0008549BE9|nr:PREDICTED: NACHT, LRR and PYD domains-containing protein 4-like [Nanorana parkeri]
MALTSGSCKDLILSILKEMREQSFKEFKEYLNDEEILTPYKPIPYSQLEGKDRLDVSGLLIQHYTKEEAPNVTLKLLEVIKEVNLAKRLKSMLCPPGVQREAQAMMEVESLQ